MISPDQIDNAKRAARATAIGLRGGCDPALGALLTAHLLAGLPPRAGAIVAGFWPMRGEIDIRPLLFSLHALGHRVVLPQTPARGSVLVFRVWSPGAAMVRERFGTERPEGEVLVPEFLLVPLLAFDRFGRRLGYGGGYYDRTLAALPGAVSVGCAFAAQEVDCVPSDAHDVRLSAVVTEAALHRFESPG